MEQSNDLKEDLKNRWRSLRNSFDANFAQRDRDFVTLEMRRRGDYAGRFSRASREWRSGINSAVVGFPVIARAMRSNTATSVATQISLNFESTTQHPSKRNAIEIAKSIYSYSEPRYWTEELETEHADLGQLGGFSAIKIEPDDDNKQKVGLRPRLSRTISVTNAQIFTCGNCGNEHTAKDLQLVNKNENSINDFSSEIADEMSNRGMDDDAILDSYKPSYEVGEDNFCPGCDKPGFLTPGDDEQVGFEDVPTGEDEEIYACEFKHEIISPLLIRFDTVGAVGFKYEKGSWFNHHFLVAKNVVIAKYPNLREKVESYGYTSWSHGAKWYYELGKPNLSLSGGAGGDEDERRWFCEIDATTFRRDFFEGWRAEKQNVPVHIGSFELDIPQGKTFIEAFEAEFKQEFTGLTVFFLHDEPLEAVPYGKKSPRFILIPWRLNPTCAVPNGEERLLKLQDQLTNVITMYYQGVIRKANAPLVANSKFFKKADLTRNQPGEIVMTKDDSDETTHTLNHIGYVEPPPQDAETLKFIDLAINTAKEESGVFDETVGSSDASNKTLGGRELAINRSLGLLGITQKSKKLGKISWIRAILEFWQDMPDEAFYMLAGVYEDSITPQDIEDFRNLIIRTELKITETKGSDVPKSAPDQFQAFEIALSLGLFMKGSPLPIHLRQHIVRNVLGLPIDVDNYEADRRLAAKRVEVIMEIIERKNKEFEIESKAYEEVSGTEDITGQQLLIAAPDKFGQLNRALNPNVLIAIEVNPQTRITEWDAHVVLCEYYDNQLKALQVTREINEPLILALQAQIQKHKDIVDLQAAQSMARANLLTGAAATATDPNVSPDGKPPLQLNPAPNGAQNGQSAPVG